MRPTSPALAATFQRTRANRTPAFTLVELLVVIGIIAALISLLLPALARARDAANAAQCMSNLRQQGAAVQMYMSDSGDFLPPYRLTYSTTYCVQPFAFEYLPMLYQTAGAQTWRCPVDNLIDVYAGAPVTRGGYPEPLTGVTDIAYSYALNEDVPSYGYSVYPTRGLKDYYTAYDPGLGSKVRNSAGLAFMLETASPATLGYNTDDLAFYRFNHIQNTAMNVLFLDGHVDSMTAKQFLPNQLNVNDTTQWPQGFGAFWFGQDGATEQLLYSGTYGNQ
jgi:prepilin-type processing-associated H-X9-DG protein